jgi:hypothetical protein
VELFAVSEEFFAQDVNRTKTAKQLKTFDF